MPLSDKSNHLSSQSHKNKTKQQHIWCEDCGKSDKTRHFQSEIDNAHAASHTASRAASHTTSRAASHTTLHFGQEVEVIVNEKYIKLKVNPTENLEHHINELLNENYFFRHKYQMSYSAKFSKHINGEENVFHKWVKSDFNYNHTNHHTFPDHTIHNTLMQKLDDEQLEGSGFVLNRIFNVILEIYKVNDIKASYIELPEKYNNQL